nr:MAG TPA: hypothetical protein [Bacteriophage sp.]
MASALGVRYSCRRKDGSNPSLPLPGAGFILVTGWSCWKTGGRRLEVFTPLLQHKGELRFESATVRFAFENQLCRNQ